VAVIAVPTSQDRFPDFVCTQSGLRAALKLHSGLKTACLARRNMAAVVRRGRIKR